MQRQAIRLVWCALITGCAGAQFGSLKKTGSAVELTAPATSARLVFVRPALLIGDASTPFIIERHSLRPFAESPAGTVVTLDVAPGQYEFCLVTPMINQTGWRQANWFIDMSTAVRTPLTRVEAAPGKTYVFEVRVLRGGMEIVPARRDSSRMRRLEEWLPELEVLTPLADSALLKPEPEEIAPWMENCVDSTPERWQMGVDDGR
jgi:hypothetical protein